MSFFAELKRRNVFRVAAAYIVAAWLVVEATSLILDIYSAPVWIVKVLIALLVLAFPITLLFSWVYELTPEGLKKESEVEHSASVAATTGKRLDIITIALLIGVAGFVLFDRFDRDQSAEPSAANSTAPGIDRETVGTPDTASPAESRQDDARPSIAVLPFADMSPQKDQEYFSDGMSEELLHLLAKIPQLKVAARTSSFQFKGDNRDISEVAAKLGVNHVLEGSVRKAGERIRVTAQLIDARDGFHLWSETYDRDLEDVLAIQDEISGEIVRSLSQKLGVAIASATRRTDAKVSTAAYDHYLRGNFAKQRRTPDLLLEAIEHYRAATNLDPDFAPAWGGLARAADLATEFFPPRDEEFAALRDQAIEVARTLDPNEPSALGSQASELFDSENNFAAGLAGLEQAVAADPSDTEAMAWLAQRYRVVGMLEKAEALNRRAYAIDPLSPRVVLGVVRTLATVGKFAEAKAIANKALRDLGGHQYAVLAMAEYHLLSGDIEGAETNLAQLRTGHPTIDVVRMQTFALLGQQQKIAEVREVAVANIPPGHFGRSLYRASASLLLGDLQSARKYMLEARERGYLYQVFWANRPKVTANVPASARPAILDFSPWIRDYPNVIRGYETLGVDIVAELEAAGVIAQ